MPMMPISKGRLQLVALAIIVAGSCGPCDDTDEEQKNCVGCWDIVAKHCYTVLEGLSFCPFETCTICPGGTHCYSQMCEPDVCDGTNCKGCCQNGHCQAGDVTFVCGKGGVTCQSCPEQDECIDGACVHPGSDLAAIMDLATASDAAVFVDAATAKDLSSTDPCPVPVISSMNPLMGTVGTTVSLGGIHLGDTSSAVCFNGTKTKIEVGDDYSMLVKVPQGATTGPLTVTTACGTGVSNSSFVVQ